MPEVAYNEDIRHLVGAVKEYLKSLDKQMDFLANSFERFQRSQFEQRLMLQPTPTSMQDIIVNILREKQHWLSSSQIRMTYFERTGQRLADSSLRHFLSTNLSTGGKEGLFEKDGTTRSTKWRYNEAFPTTENT